MGQEYKGDQSQILKARLKRGNITSGPWEGREGGMLGVEGRLQWAFACDSGIASLCTVLQHDVLQSNAEREVMAQHQGSLGLPVIWMGDRGQKEQKIREEVAKVL